jgi:hypothetical protein
VKQFSDNFALADLRYTPLHTGALTVAAAHTELELIFAVVADQNQTLPSRRRTKRKATRCAIGGKGL